MASTQTTAHSNGQIDDTDALSRPVKMILDVTKQQAQAFGIVMALFTGSLASLAQTIAPVMIDSDDTPTSWKALRIFLYSAMILNFSGTFICLAIIKMCTDLPIAAYQAALLADVGTMHQEPQSRPGTVSQVLTDANMSRGYKYINLSLTVVFIAACVCTFAALTFWVLLSETTIVAGVTMIVFGVVGINAIVVSAIVSRGQLWI